ELHESIHESIRKHQLATMERTRPLGPAHHADHRGCVGRDHRASKGRRGGTSSCRGDSPQRAETLGRVVRYLIALAVSVIAVMLVLAEIGISLAPILGAA